MQWWKQNKSIIDGCRNKEASNLSILELQVYFLIMLYSVSFGEAVEPLSVSSQWRAQAEGAPGVRPSHSRRKAHTNTLQVLAGAGIWRLLTSHWPKQIEWPSLMLQVQEGESFLEENTDVTSNVEGGAVLSSYQEDAWALRTGCTCTVLPRVQKSWGSCVSQGHFSCSKEKMVSNGPNFEKGNMPGLGYGRI